VIRLHVNIDHVATLRNQRDTRYPDPVLAAGECELAGADGITAHLREDRRHIRDRDVERLRESVCGWFNLELAATDEMRAVAERIKPDSVTLVPERREERTTEGGLDVIAGAASIRAMAKQCDGSGVKLSLFIEPEVETVRRSLDLGARQVEFHTGRYALTSGVERESELERLRECAALAAGLGLEVAAGHALTFHNVLEVARISELGEVNIGHALVSDAVLLGLRGAVRRMRVALDRGEEARSGA